LASHVRCFLFPEILPLYRRGELNKMISHWSSPLESLSIFVTSKKRGMGYKQGCLNHRMCGPQLQRDDHDHFIAHHFNGAFSFRTFTYFFFRGSFLKLISLAVNPWNNVTVILKFYYIHFPDYRLNEIFRYGISTYGDYKRIRM